MKKTALFLTLIIIISVLCGCASLEALKKEHPTLFKADVSQGLELFITKSGEGEYLCTLTSGSDFVNTSIGLTICDNVDTDTMKSILESYRIKDKQIEVYLFSSPDGEHIWEEPILDADKLAKRLGIEKAVFYDRTDVNYIPEADLTGLTEYFDGEGMKLGMSSTELEEMLRSIGCTTTVTQNLCGLGSFRTKKRGSDGSNISVEGYSASNGVESEGFTYSKGNESRIFDLPFGAEFGESITDTFLRLGVDHEFRDTFVSDDGSKGIMTVYRDARYKVTVSLDLSSGNEEELSLNFYENTFLSDESGETAGEVYTRLVNLRYADAGDDLTGFTVGAVTSRRQGA